MRGRRCLRGAARRGARGLPRSAPPRVRPRAFAALQRAPGPWPRRSWVHARPASPAARARFARRSAREPPARFGFALGGGRLARAPRMGEILRVRFACSSARLSAPRPHPPRPHPCPCAHRRPPQLISPFTASAWSRVVAPRHWMITRTPHPTATPKSDS